MDQVVVICQHVWIQGPDLLDGTGRRYCKHCGLRQWRVLGTWSNA